MTSAEKSTAGAQLTREAVTKVLADAFRDLGIASDGLTPGVRLREDLELDSTELVQISLEVARHLDVQVQLEAGDDVTLDEVTDLIMRRASGEGADAGR